MSETRCRFVASDQPRVLVGRHEDGCEDEGCRGCLSCPMDHCRVCGIEHASGACPGCVGAVREDLAEIVKLYIALPTEVAHRGIDGEAMNLLGPVADPEAWGHVSASVAVGRLPREWQVELGEHHPLTTLVTWEDVYRDALQHPSERPVSVAEASEYLGRHLTDAGGYEWVPFEDFARDVRTCVSHLERVLHDGEQIDEGVPCMTCHRRLTRVWGVAGKEDGWECRLCREYSTEDQYRFAVKADYIAKAEWLTDVDMTVRVKGITATTVRSWAATKGDRPVLIRKTLHSQRTVYSVEDVQWIYACTKDGEHAA
jgi:hypothetical protein